MSSADEQKALILVFEHLNVNCFSNTYELLPYLLYSEWVSESRSVVSDSFRHHVLYSPWNFPGQNAGVGSLSLLQGIFPTQRLNQVSRIAGGFFISWTTREAQEYWNGLPIPSSVDLPDPGIKPESPALQEDSLPTELSGKPWGNRVASQRVSKYLLIFAVENFDNYCTLTLPSRDCSLPEKDPIFWVTSCSNKLLGDYTYYFMNLSNCSIQMQEKYWDQVHSTYPWGFYLWDKHRSVTYL